MLRKKSQQFITGFLIFAIIFSQVAYPITAKADEELAPPSPVDNGEAGPAPTDVMRKLADTPTIQQTGANANQSAPAQSVSLFQTDLFSGKASSSVPIALPAGRAGMQPSVALTYTSSNENGLAGVGWNFGTGSIQRETKDGVPNYDSLDNFVANFSGASGKLVRTGSNSGNIYYYKLESDPTSMDFSYVAGDHWSAVDNKGNVYYFGQNYNSNVNLKGFTKLIASSTNLDDSSRTFAWNLNKVIDVNGNYYEVGYERTSGGTVVLSLITYTGNSNTGEAGKYQVYFGYTPRTGFDNPSNYRLGFQQTLDRVLKTITVQYDNSQQISRYVINYTASPQTNRPLLTSVETYGSDNTLLVNPVQFTYQNGSKNWSSNGTYTLSADYWSIVDHRYSPIDQGIRFADINGDGLLDMVKTLGRDGTAGNPDPGWEPSRGNYYAVWLQTKEGTWQYDTTFRNSLYNACVEANAVFSKNAGYYNNGDWGLRLVDVNADNKADLVLARKNWFASGQTEVPTTGVWLNNGNGWTKDPNWAVPDIFISWTNSYSPNSGGNYYDQGMRIADVNGDGYVDLIQGLGGDAWASYNVYINNKTSWVFDQSWTNAYNRLQDNNPIPFTYWYRGQRSIDTGLQIVDVNGDGLADFIQGRDNPGPRYVWLNNGSGWTRAGYDLPAAFVAWSWVSNGSATWYSSLDQGMRMGDINGDGLIDLVKTYNFSGDQKVWLNTGQGWQLDNSWSGSIPKHFISWTNPTTYSNGVELLDINSDGAADFVQGLNGSGTTWLNQSANADLLTKVTNSLGGTSEIQYKSSATQKTTGTNSEPMPFNTPVVSSITNKSGYKNSDGSDQSYVTTYDYYDGKYNVAKKEFRGFGKVRVIDVAGNYTDTYFKQDNILKGKILQTKSYNSQNQLWNTITNAWSYESLSSKSPSESLYRIYLNGSTTTFNDGTGEKSTEVQYTYDPYNNPITVKSLGDVSTGGDEKTVETVYNNNPSNHLYGQVKTTSVKNSNSALIKKSDYYYDGANSLDTPPTKGFVTKQTVWNDSGNSPTTKMEYDTYGNMIKGYDAKNIPIETEYDSILHQYPVKIKQKVGGDLTPKGGTSITLETTNTYDIARGLLLSTTDPNGLITRSEYDSLGRVTKQFKPTDTTVPSVSYDYYLKDAGIPRIFQYVTLPSGGTQTSAVFYDGLGRTMFTYTQNPYGGPNDIISGQVDYDNLGRVYSQYTSYFSQYGNDYSKLPVIPQSVKNARSVSEYDHMSRVTKTTLAPITADQVISQTEYNQWQTTTKVDGKYKYRNYFDAYKHLIKVDELNADGSTYSNTNYAYDAADNLVKVTDSKGNITQLAYDALGRKTFMTDPDMGTWEYTYDINGNLTKQKDAKNQTVDMLYDDLNRLVKKITSEKTVNYYYDTNPYDATAQYTKGKLTATNDGTTQTIFWFDQLGREIKNQKKLDGQTYEIKKEYDSLDRLTKVIQPENPNTHQKDEIYYAYYDIGAIKTITGKENGQNKTYVADITYNEQGQKTKIKYGNGTITTYDYNPNNQLLNNLITADSSGVKKIQDLAYQFDKTGNVSTITDNLENSRTQNYQYDNLSRLTQAKGAYGTIAYTYDQIGNLTSKNSVQYHYGENGDGPHALTSKVDSGQTSSYSYDTNGNMINRNGDTLVYDSENHMIQAQYDKSTASIKVELKKGWNFISLPFDSTDKDIKTVLSSLKIGEDYNQISRWNPDTQTYEHYANLGADQFTKLDYGRGFAINVLKDNVTLTLRDNISTSISNQTLKKGWNVIGSDSSKNLTKEEFLAKFGNSTGIQIFRYNAENYSWEFCGREFTDIEPDKGYAVYVGNATTRTLKDSNISAKGTTQFVYDENGGRIKKIDGDKTNTYLGPSFELEKTGINTTVVESIFEGDNRIVSNNDGTDYWYHQNHLGSTDVMTDSTGRDARTRVEYYPYGQTFKQTGDTDLTKYLYTGKELDEGTELYYYGARYYDPDLQRFTQADTIVPSPSNPQSFNRYSYAANNPIIYNDPSGHFIIPVMAMVWGALIGGASAAATGGNIIQGIIGGAISGAIFSYIGGLHLSGFNAAGAHFLGGALSGGINAAMSGGNILQGMAVGGVSAGVSKLIPGINSGFERAGVGALMGGLTAMAMGGNFAEGAKMGFITSSIAFVCNETQHPESRQTRIQEALDWARDQQGARDSYEGIYHEYCARFAHRIADKAGIPFPESDNVPYIINDAKRDIIRYSVYSGSDVKNGYYTPRAGDRIILSFPGSSNDHIGTVIDYNPITNNIWTIEGNTKRNYIRGIWTKNRPLDSSQQFIRYNPAIDYVDFGWRGA